ncbi:proteasome regulatory particle lid subunit RPN8 [Sugiyamaella lignohabitans]|uniref:26S proteasome regulatory subunit RPN8 n=1 Tax=Sugiyamaella lignohabitans TaxID=796027 RepID=A0A161HGS9_9ASCO|nr:proteasome regulatory particle lid subunit RPN8 [Sugiyamaella lignohabitans]ANB15010.1 proteasome regulatory particle lid subunit RPN8 [Sugiyamaella lignohabitans]
MPEPVTLDEKIAVATPIGTNTSASPAVTVAPLVLLSVVDHYNRIAKDTKKRVVGVILGDNNGKGTIRVTNSFAVPFEEDEKNPGVWFLDHNYIEGMRDMFRKVNAKEKLIGWYHSGPKLRASDLQINELFKKYTQDPLLLIVDVQPKTVGIPTDAYLAVEEIKDDGTTSDKTFVHVPSLIEAEEAEEIGVEHLLRDIRDAAAGSLATRITNQLTSLQGLHNHLRGIAAYLQKVLDGQLPVNHVILGKLQDVFNLLPNLATPTVESNDEATTSLNKAFTVKTNDELMVVYLSSLVRAIIAFHNLIENKIENKGESAAATASSSTLVDTTTGTKGEAESKPVKPSDEKK